MINKYPYTDFHELNADWIIEKVGNIEANVSKASEDAQSAEAARTAAQASATAAARDAQSAAQSKAAAGTSEANAAGSEASAASSEEIASQAAQTAAQEALTATLAAQTLAEYVSTYNAAQTYMLNDVVRHDGRIYKCVAPITIPEAWTAAHWQEINIVDLSTALRGDIDELAEDLLITAGLKRMAFIPKMYIDCSAGVGEVIDLVPKASPTTGYHYAITKCNPGDVFTINATGGVAPRVWAFIDANDVIISLSASNANMTDAIIMAPDGADRIIVNDRSGRTSYIGFNRPVKNEEEISELKHVTVSDFTWTEYSNITGSAISALKTSDVYAMYDLLPDARKIETQTKDESGLYNMTYYRIAKDHNVRHNTIMLFSGVHGDEKNSIAGLYFALKYMEENHPDVFVKYQVVVIPVCNPWGVDNNKHYNFNGVNINRNFPVNWEYFTDSTSGGSGSEPESESETRFIRGIIDAYKSRCIAASDCHGYNPYITDFVSGTYESLADFSNDSDYLNRMKVFFIREKQHIKGTVSASGVESSSKGYADRQGQATLNSFLGYHTIPSLTCESSTTVSLDESGAYEYYTKNAMENTYNHILCAISSIRIY